MLKRIVMAVTAVLMLFGESAFAQEGNVPLGFNGAKFDFAKDDEGFVPIFADYPAGEGVDEFYELDYGYREIPIDNAGKGLFISGNNHSDDLFMGYYKELKGFAVNETFVIDISFKIATNAERNMIGIGGSPGSSVYVKCGVSAKKPAAVQNEQNQYRLNIDKGNQGSDGKDMKIVGTIEKTESLLPDKYEFNNYNIRFEGTANQDGTAYIIIGTDSGFEGTTSYYIGDINISRCTKGEDTYEEQLRQNIKNAVSVGIIDASDFALNESISREEFCEIAYNMLNLITELPQAKLDSNPFGDTNNPKVNALSFAGIVNGKSENMFFPKDEIAREEAAVILYRIANYSNLEIPAVKIDTEYSDNGEISDWAISSVYSIKVLNIIESGADERFNPKANYTFGESVSSIMKLYNLIKK